jgi:hypothetical protein
VPPLQHHTTHPAFALRHWILFRLPFLVRSQNPSLTTTNPTQEGAAAAASFSSGHRIRVQQQLIRHWRESRSFGTTDRFRCKKFVLLNKSPCSSPNPLPSTGGARALHPATSSFPGQARSDQERGTRATGVGRAATAATLKAARSPGESRALLLHPLENPPLSFYS